MAALKKYSAGQRLVIEYYRAKFNLMHVVSSRWALRSAMDLFQTPYPRRPKKDPPIWKYAEPLWLHSEREKLAGFRWTGEGNPTKKMLIVHGFAGNCRSFDAYIKPALRKGYEVVAYDAPAHGKSSGKHLNLLKYASVLEDILRQHGPFDAFLAHSLGGMSLMMALERTGQGANARVALVAPLIEVSRAAQNFSGFLQIPPALHLNMIAAIEKRAGKPVQWFSLPRMVESFPGNIYWVHDRQDDTTPFSDMAHLVEQPPAHVVFHITDGLGHSGVYRNNEVKRAIIGLL